MTYTIRKSIDNLTVQRQSEPQAAVTSWLSRSYLLLSPKTKFLCSAFYIICYNTCTAGRFVTIGAIREAQGFPGGAVAATKLFQSCPTLCDPIEGSPSGSSVPGILQARTLGCHFLLQVVLVVGNLPASVGDRRNEGSLPGSGRSLGGGDGAPLPCSCLENSMDRKAHVVPSHLCTLNIPSPKSTIH